MDRAAQRLLLFSVLLLIMSLLPACNSGGDQASSTALTDAQLEDLVKRSYPYVAMYNVNNKFAISQGGWNTLVADTQLKDHTMRDIARPNNDTLYISALLDLRHDPVILEWPAFDSKYVSLMITAYDHHVNIPKSTREGDFRSPGKLLVYSAHTDDYDGQAIEGVDDTFEATGDFVSAVFRVMPHANEPERFARIKGQMKEVRALTLAEFNGDLPKPIDDIEFPAVGETDAVTFGTNLLEVMQFVFNHTSLDPEDPDDSAVLAIYAPLGVVPGQSYDPEHVAKLDGAKLRATAERIASEELALATDPDFQSNMAQLFKPKGEMSNDLLRFQSVLGPIGMPAQEALYPAIATADGQPMNALHDYVIRMSKDDLPPAEAFWSVTLYDTARGFFIPNARKKYSVGENAGMKLDEDGGIAIYIAAEKPEGVPEENWLPIERKDEGIGPILRIYVPDMEAMKTWKAPVAEKLGG